MKPELWLIMIVLGVVTFLIRWSFLLLAGSIRMHPTFVGMMKFIPASVFAALSLPALLFHQPQSYEFHGFERLGAGLVGLIVAYFTSNVLATIVAGLLSLWIFKSIGL